MSRKDWTSEKVFHRLLTNRTRKTYWENISELRSRPNQEVFDKAKDLVKSNDAEHRIVGIDVLQQLGFDPRYNKKEMVDLHFKLLDNHQPDDLLISVFHGIGHNNEDLSEKQVSKLVEYKDIENVDVKLALISAISGLENEAAISVLIDYTEDQTASIRDWATFGLGSLCESDSGEIRNALMNRLGDSDFEIRSEAIVGLANRKDQRVKAVIISELKEGNYGTLIFEAILTLEDKDFLPHLERNLEVARKDEEDIANGWDIALQETMKELN